MIGVPRRLGKFIGEATGLDRERAYARCREGRIQVITESFATTVVDGQSYVFDEDLVLLDGTPIRPRSHAFAAKLHKPRGVVSSARDPHGQRDLSEWLATCPSGTAPSGRLDRDSTGLLVLTSDGDLSDALRRPDERVPKRYWLWLDDSERDLGLALRRFESGVRCGPHHLAAASAKLITRHEHSVEVEVVLESGKHRQIRRMCKAVGLRLLHLHRASIGSLELGALQSGALEPLGVRELDRLWQGVGGHRQQRARRIEALRRQARLSREQGHPQPRLEAWLAAQLVPLD